MNRARRGPAKRYASIMGIAGVVLAVVVLAPAAARADDNELVNYTIGPVLGVHWGGRAESGTVLGVEGGVGAGLLRGNVGIDHRAGRLLTYVEVDPWLLVGGTVGFGVDSAGDVQPVLGLWEVVPLVLPRCGTNDYGKVVMLSFGYRYTGVHELYGSIKAGVSQPFCL